MARRRKETDPHTEDVDATNVGGQQSSRHRYVARVRQPSYTTLSWCARCLVPLVMATVMCMLCFYVDRREGDMDKMRLCYLAQWRFDDGLDVLLLFITPSLFSHHSCIMVIREEVCWTQTYSDVSISIPVWMLRSGR